MTCAFTGHRQILPEHRTALIELLQVAINQAYDLGYRKFITGGALGFDTEAARELIRFRISHSDISLSVYVPYIGQEENWSPAQKDAYAYILSSANEVKYISENYDSQCMKRRNQAMVNDCDMLIAYVYRDRTGSSQTVRMARDMGREIINLYNQLSIADI